MSNDDAGKKILDLLADPFSKQLQSTAIWSALGTSLGVTVGIAVTFSFLRPYNQSVYAPKLKHADEKHAPPPIGKKIWSWIPPLWNTGEAELVHHVGMDATVFLRFVRMCIFIFASISVFCIAILIPVYLNNADKQALANRDWIEVITPLAVWGESAYWAQVAVAYLITFTVMGFLWWNYRKVMLLRRNYFQSEEYQNSLHARTLMMYDIPKDRCSDEGIARIVDEVVPDSSFARTAIARNVKDLPNLIEQHDHTVRKLESVLAKYLKKPDQLPAGRPMCKPSKKDPSFSTYPKGQKVDAIEYLTQRIKELETEIKEVRASVDKRSTMPYGFASYSDIAEAHNIAYATRKKHPRGTKISLAPRPNDVIWDNLPLSAANRRWRRFINNVWIAVLTVVWIVPNAMIAIFLINFQNLGSVWPAFKTELATNPTFWAIVQGIASPAIMSLVYLVLPMIFRQLSMKAGDQTKTGRERHVLAKLYAFFVFNNLIVFSLFGTIWQLVAAVVKETSDNQDAWKAIIDQDIAAAVFAALCQVSPYWVTWLLQRQLGAAIDLAQLWKLVYSFFVRKFSSPTPRELIELTAPPTFEYASYYNYFLYYATIALAFSGIQPLVLPAATLYYAIDYWLKKYLLLYTFVTKTESGGMFWRVLFNRFLFAVFVSHCTFFLGAWARSDWAYHSVAIAIIPLPIILIIFKIVCARMFDNKIHYYSTTNVRKHPEAGVQKEQRLRSERLASRFGHPALYKPLITPMVHAKAQAILPAVYKGRLTDGREAGPGDIYSVSGYSDAYVLDPMSKGRPGKSAGGVPGFEFVSESHMDFEYYKNRAEFAEEHGQGDIFGRNPDIIRPGTPGSMTEYGSDNGSRPGTPTGRPLQGGMTGNPANGGFQAFTPPSGYQSPNTGRMSPTGGLPTPQAAFAQQSTYGDRSRSPLYNMDNGSDSALVRNAAGMPMAQPSGPTVGALGGGPRGYSGLRQDDAETPEQDPSSYDYFRGSRRRNDNNGW
ncbi:hypotheticall protein [Colletotrichum siamense]|uniref:Hypotheticall protein n=1 Tax=Colletotrichum siamense TaxID=690259 RepID=A0A9P5KA85_COLSI|nr:Uncharacterized protein CGCS363_v009869 [Colletotrichum siamense]KAI8167713.1 hypothetical protein KHU50_006434 [Colletotrichum sp. SAR 10_65]KAI8191210.1 hypothetical protein K4K51_013020 [Colletotrichum sp. SAR 10_75]KAI8223447.1 hypothetical protein K4K53_006911 [Colletotrichum sp. SAR 10_77]KAI8231087.1 hypothetical protein K4K55_006320 [Colletotrichum sp. SAR 10_96]KAJ5011009.1 hypothetical protein K4K57_006351 [Colletotrichum sp. SAR 10_99]